MPVSQIERQKYQIALAEEIVGWLASYSDGQQWTAKLIDIWTKYYSRDVDDTSTLRPLMVDIEQALLDLYPARDDQHRRDMQAMWGNTIRRVYQKLAGGSYALKSDVERDIMINFRPMRSGADSRLDILEAQSAYYLEQSVKNAISMYGVTEASADSLSMRLVWVHPDCDSRYVLLRLIDKFPEAAWVLYSAFATPPLDDYMWADLERAFPGITRLMLDGAK